MFQYNVKSTFWKWRKTFGADLTPQCVVSALRVAPYLMHLTWFGHTNRDFMGEIIKKKNVLRVTYQSSSALVTLPGYKLITLPGLEWLTTFHDGFDGANKLVLNNNRTLNRLVKSQRQRQQSCSCEFTIFGLLNSCYLLRPMTSVTKKDDNSLIGAVMSILRNFAFNNIPTWLVIVNERTV